MKSRNRSHAGFPCMSVKRSTSLLVLTWFGLVLGSSLSDLAVFAADNTEAAAVERTSEDTSSSAPKLKVSYPSSAILVADEFEIVLEVEVAGQATVSFIDAPFDDVIYYQVQEPVDQSFSVDLEGGRRLWRRQYLLECYEAGEQSFSGFQALVHLPDQNDPLSLNSGPFQIQVKGVVEPDAKLDGFKDLRELTRENASKAPTLLLWGAGVFSFFSLIGLALWCRKRRKNDSPRSVALMQLLAWRSELVSGVTLSGGYEQLVRILREYFGSVFELNSTSSSNLELVAELSKADLPEQLIRQTEHFLHCSDMARFSVDQVKSSQPSGLEEVDTKRTLEDASEVVRRLIDDVTNWQSAQENEGVD